MKQENWKDISQPPPQKKTLHEETQSLHLNPTTDSIVNAYQFLDYQLYAQKHQFIEQDTLSELKLGCNSIIWLVNLLEILFLIILTSILVLLVTILIHCWRKKKKKKDYLTHTLIVTQTSKFNTHVQQWTKTADGYFSLTLNCNSFTLLTIVVATL